MCSVYYNYKPVRSNRSYVCYVHCACLCFIFFFFLFLVSLSHILHFRSIFFSVFLLYTYLSEFVLHDSEWRRKNSLIWSKFVFINYLNYRCCHKNRHTHWQCIPCKKKITKFYKRFRVYYSRKRENHLSISYKFTIHFIQQQQ